MDNNKGFQTRGDSNNPHHLSVGAVVFDENQIALVKKSDGLFTLPRETMYSEESLTLALQRGLREELGIEVTVEKFIGSQVTFFSRADDTKIEKTTIYFICHKIKGVEKRQEEDELNDEIVWMQIRKAQQILKDCGNEEWKLLVEN